MGSKTLSQAEAAQMLGVSRRTVLRLIHRGCLTGIKHGHVIMVDEEEVARYKKVGDEPSPAIAFSPKNFAKLWEDVQMMKAQLIACMRLLNMKMDSLQLEDQELKNLYTMTGYYAAKGWPPQAEDSFASTFMRVQTADLEQIKKLTEDEHPWRPFYLLCTLMSLTPYDKGLKDVFAAGRAHLHGLAYIWGQMHGYSPHALELLMRQEATPGRRLLHQIEHKQEGFSEGENGPKKVG